MSWCSVLGCQVDKDSVRDEYSFPGIDEIELRENWIKFCGQLPDWKPDNHAKICRAHFKYTDFKEDQKADLKSRAFPSLRVSLLYLIN